MGVKMNIKSIGSAAFLAKALPSAASAEIVEAIYTGVVTSSTDQTGIFNQGVSQSNANVGQTYTATFIYDTSLGGNLSTLYGSPSYTGNYGGMSLPGWGANPVLSPPRRR
jgi:hypothetical protein